MVFTSNFHDTTPLHPLKRSVKVRLRKEEEKRKKEKTKLLNELKYGKRLK